MQKILWLTIIALVECDGWEGEACEYLIVVSNMIYHDHTPTHTRHFRYYFTMITSLCSTDLERSHAPVTNIQLSRTEYELKSSIQIKFEVITRIVERSRNEIVWLLAVDCGIIIVL